MVEKDSPMFADHTQFSRAALLTFAELGGVILQNKPAVSPCNGELFPAFPAGGLARFAGEGDDR